MTTTWVVYGLAIATLLGAAAALLEAALRVRGLPARGAWMAALGATLVLTATAPGRAETVTIPAATTVSMTEITGAPQMEDALSGASAFLAAFARPLDARTVAVVWTAASLLLIAILLFTLLRARAARRSWPLGTIDGASVRVSPAAGPLVAGVLHPEIVVPRWLLNAPEAEQRLVMAHERQHVRGRDPLLLTVGCVLAALLPWNPAVWWMLSRLRLAVELDCDRRVVGAGADRSEYGTVLLDVASRTDRRFSFAPALLAGPTQLERRLVIMTNRIPRFASARALLFTAAAALLVLTACEASLPTATQIEEMDVATAEATLTRFEVAEASGEVVYLIDGKEATADEARALDADRIATIEVRGGEGINKGGNEMVASRVLIRTSDDAAVSSGGGNTSGVVLRATKESNSPAKSMEGFTGILVLDGVIIDSAEFGKLNPDEIQSIEIIKGEAAARLYDSPRARNGVIQITTKAHAAGRD